MSKVSVIIPCYNKGKYVKGAINSVLGQTYPDIETVIINDGSTDDSADVIAEFIKDKPNIKFINNSENRGVIYARNAAIDASSGDYILPLDADDEIEPSYIEKAVKILDGNEKIGMVYCRAKFIGDKNDEWQLPEYKETDFLYANCIFCSALFRKSDFLKAGKYKEYANVVWEDWDLWLSFIELGLIPYRIDETLFNYRQLNESTRTHLTDGRFKEGRKVILKNHLNLYLNNPDFANNCFEFYYIDKQYKELQKNLKNLEKYIKDCQNKAENFQELAENIQKHYEDLQVENQKTEKKRKKYKKFSNLLLPMVIIEALVIAAFILHMIIF